jgi:hypothetical protein
MLDWVKKNPTSTVWMVAAAVIAGFFGAAAAGATVLSIIAAVVTAVVTSAYLALYLYQGPTGLAALKRLIPAAVVGVIIFALWYAGFAIPSFVMSGVYAACMALWVAAAFARLRSRD